MTFNDPNLPFGFNITGGTQQPNSEIGTPQADQYFMDGPSNYDDTCAIKCQEHIIQMFTEIDISEEQLVQDAMNYGWYTPGEGTAIGDIGYLLELYGVPVNRFEQANIYHLANELAQGHKVMVAVDSEELRNGPGLFESVWEALGLDAGADQAVVVSGIDTTEPDNPIVIVSDPGTGETAARYPLEQFLGAWQDSNFSMVSTQQPAPHSAPGMESFPYDLGYLPTVLDLPYEQFAAYDPYEWEQYFNVNDVVGSGADLDRSTWDYPALDSNSNYAVDSYAVDSYGDSSSALDDYDAWARDYANQLGGMALDSAEVALHCGDYETAAYYAGVAESDYADADYYDSYTDSYDSYYSASDDSYTDYSSDSYDDIGY